MQQLGLSLTDGDVKAMMKSVDVGPNGKISFSGKYVAISRRVCAIRTTCDVTKQFIASSFFNVLQRVDI